jgi:hypothetical protein
MTPQQADRQRALAESLRNLPAAVRSPAAPALPANFGSNLTPAQRDQVLRFSKGQP